MSHPLYDPGTYWPARYARQGDTYVAKGGRRSSYRQQVRALTPHFRHLPSEGRVLDFGCGPGRFRPALESHGLTYEGVDLVPGLGTMDVGDIEPGSFDAAVAIYVLQHIVDEGEYRDAVDLLATCLRPGGVLLVVDHEEMEHPAAHMQPRGPTPVFSSGFRAASDLGSVDNHWIRRFVR